MGTFSYRHDEGAFPKISNFALISNFATALGAPCLLQNDLSIFENMVGPH